MSSKSFSKKAAIDLQFNWIFVIVAGLAILGVFLVQTQVSTQRAQADANLVIREAIQTLIASPAEENYREVNLGIVAIRNTCETGLGSTLYVGRGMLPIHTTYHALHAPSVTTSRKLQLQTYEGSSMLTGTDHEYIFVNTDPKILSLYNNFPGNKRLVRLLEESDNPPTGGSLRYTMVYYGTNGEQPDVDFNIAAKDFDIVMFVEGREGQANLVYFGKSSHVSLPGFLNKGIEFSGVGEAMGAIIDSDLELYTCLHEYELEKQIRKYYIIQRVRRALETSEEVSQSCKNIYQIIGPSVNNIILELTGSNERKLLNIEDDVKDLQKRNLDLARNNCPVLQ